MLKENIRLEKNVLNDLNNAFINTKFSINK